MNGAPLLPDGNTVLGVMGGGQLGRMFVQAAQQMGYGTAVLDPDEHSPAGAIAHHHVRAAYDDPRGLAELARLSNAITTEFENVPASALEQLAAKRFVAPSASCVAIAQDRRAEKAHFTACGVPVAPYAVIETLAQLPGTDADLFPGILKTARLGYDGKGQATVNHAADLASAWRAMGSVPCVLEKRLPLAAECSVVIARGRDGQVVYLPVQRNEHRGGILARTEVHDGNLPPVTVKQSLEATKKIADDLNYVGVLCVEFFVLDGGQLVVNEIAPRPHNSGHHSQDSCDVSQFHLQVRALAGLPLTSPRLHSPTVMLNLLGDLWFTTGQEQTPPWDSVLALPGAHLHLYGKAGARPGRKMGHLNLTAASIEAARANARRACRILGIAPGESPC